MRRRSFGIRMAAAVGLCLLVVQGASMAAGAPIGLTTPVQATKNDLNPGRLYSPPAFAVDPGNNMRVLAAVADHRSRRCHVLRSTDGGQSWTMLEASPALASYPFCSHGQGGIVQAAMAFGRNGTVYLAMNAWDDQDGARRGGAIVVARSRDLGDTWETTMVYNSRGKTGDAEETIRPFHAFTVDTRTGNDDVVFVAFAINAQGLSAPNAAPGKAMVSVSRDGARTFAEPVDLAENMFETPEPRQQMLSAVTTTVPAAGATTTTTTIPPANSKAAQPNQAANFGASTNRASMTAGVDGKGKVYVSWLTGTANITPAPPSARMLSTSTDGGRTWTTTQAMPPSYDVPSRPAMAVSKEGIIHLVFQDNPTPAISGMGEIYHQASTDGGKTWSERKKVTDDPDADMRGQYFPNVSVASNGRVDVVWWDTRDDPGIRANDMYYAYSEDNGRTWSQNRRITDRSVDRRLGVWGANYDINSAPAVASTNAYAIFGWDDTRNTDGVWDPDVNKEFGGGLSDMYTSVAQFEVVGPANNDLARVVLAAVVGLLIVGLVLLGVAVAAKRRNPPASMPVTGKQTGAKVG
ncbi:MAG TPA: sialidase family protein [Acidimicrobiales bacterium]|nr:sialidase family protein [Acidimicrobiales bacterium]